MKNNKKHIRSHFSVLSAMSFLALLLLFTSCEKEDEAYTGPITLNKVFLQDFDSNVPDREVTFVRLGQTIRIEGSGFSDLRKIEVNGYETYFNPVMTTDGNILFKVSDDTPVIDADPSVRNTIKFTNDGSSTVFAFDIRDAAPTVSKISNTLPLAGETITVYGSGLTEIARVVFPGEIEVTTDIVSDPKGEFFTVTVPDGVSDEGGSLLIEGANGGVYTPAYFNFKKGVILDFDGNGTQGYWGEAVSMIWDTDLASYPTGIGNISQGIYTPHRPSRIAEFAPATNRCSEVWTAGNGVDDWRTQLTPYIPTTTPVDQVAFQFDIFVPAEWTGSGYLKVLLINNYNGGEWAGYTYNYVPWIVDGEEVPFVTEGWTTVTIPFSKFYALSDDASEFTFENVLAAREGSNYKNFGFYFENSNFTLNRVTENDNDSETEFISKATSVEVYTDNWRVVPLDTPTYSDFPDEETAAE